MGVVALDGMATATYGELLRVVTYDAHLFAPQDEHRTKGRLADELLAVEDAADRAEDPLDNETTVVRSLKLLRAEPSRSYGYGKTPEQSVWPHAKAFLAVEYVSAHEAQWLLLVRSHWGVESSHHTLDTAFAEDDRSASRTDDGRTVRSRALLTWVRDVLVAATEAQLAGLRDIPAARR